MDWPGLVYIAALAAVIAVVPFSLARTWLRDRSPGVSGAFKGIAVPAARQLRVEEAAVTWIAHEVETTRKVVRVGMLHNARLPYVVQLEGGKVRCYDKKGYEEWAAQGGDPRGVPLPVQQLCDLDLLRRLQGVDGLSSIAGLIAIEPGRIVAVEDGGPLSAAYAQQVAAVMLAVAEEAEKPAFAVPTAKAKESPALS
ncbi:MAG: hypothetical protein WD533_00395 [Dehalococcoidia bacterium]